MVRHSPTQRFALRALAIALMSVYSLTAGATDHEASISQLVDTDIKRWLENPQIVRSLRNQNSAHAALTRDDIDRLDKQWRAEIDAADRPLISRTMSTPLSLHLRNLREQSTGLYTEIFLIDNQGLNVAQSDVTSDYWQGDEAKWQKTYLMGPDAVFIDEVEIDESTQQFQSQVSLSITDPRTGDVIGALTVGVNVDALEQ